MTGAVIFDGRTRLTFAEPHGPGSVVDYLTVRIEGPDLSASRQVYAGWESGFLGLAAHFETLAESWRGWDGRAQSRSDRDSRRDAVGSRGVPR